MIEDALAARHVSVEAVGKYLVPNPNLDGTAADIASVTEGYVATMLGLIPEDSPELTAGLRHLLEAKDCFVRASLPL